MGDNGDSKRFVLPRSISTTRTVIDVAKLAVLKKQHFGRKFAVVYFDVHIAFRPTGRPASSGLGRTIERAARLHPASCAPAVATGAIFLSIVKPPRRLSRATTSPVPDGDLAYLEASPWSSYLTSRSATTATAQDESVQEFLPL